MNENQYYRIDEGNPTYLPNKSLKVFMELSSHKGVYIFKEIGKFYKVDVYEKKYKILFHIPASDEMFLYDKYSLSYEKIFEGETGVSFEIKETFYEGGFLIKRNDEFFLTNYFAEVTLLGMEVGLNCFLKKEQNPNKPELKYKISTIYKDGVGEDRCCSYVLEKGFVVCKDLNNQLQVYPRAPGQYIIEENNEIRVYVCKGSYWILEKFNVPSKE